MAPVCSDLIPPTVFNLHLIPFPLSSENFMIV